jgi:hypothetical protein
MKHLLNKLAIRLLQNKGFRGEAATIVLAAIKKDVRAWPIPLKTKLWAWHRGFAASRVATYGINEANWRLHVPDFDYYRLHPYNGQYSHWINDKLTIYYLLDRFKCLPQYYFQLDDEKMLRLPDCPDDVKADTDGLITLLDRYGDLAIKPTAGSLGQGFYRISAGLQGYSCNLAPITRDDLMSLINRLKGSLVTEYVRAHPDLLALNVSTPNTVRVQAVRPRGQAASITGSFIRIGSRASGVRETPLAGALIGSIDLVSGLIGRAFSLSDGRLSLYTHHPDSGKPLAIKVPHWELIRQSLIDILNDLPQLSNVGFDLIVTQDGFRIIEINSLTATTGLPYFYPLLDQIESRCFYRERFSEHPKRFRRVLRQINELERQDDKQKQPNAEREQDQFERTDFNPAGGPVVNPPERPVNP